MRRRRDFAEKGLSGGSGVGWRVGEHRVNTLECRVFAFVVLQSGLFTAKDTKGRFWIGTGSGEALPARVNSADKKLFPKIIFPNPIPIPFVVD